MPLNTTEAKRFTDLCEVDLADRQVVEERCLAATTVAEDMHEKLLAAQAKLTSVHEERVSLEEEAERLHDFGMRDQADAKQLAEDHLMAEVQAYTQEEQRVWEVMEGHRQEKARLAESAQTHREQVDQFTAAAEATRQGADLLALKAGKREATRRDEEARVKRLTGTYDEAFAALTRVQDERRSGEAKAKGMEAARIDAEAKSTKAAREYEKRRAARVPLNELLGQEIAQLKMAQRALDIGRMDAIRKREARALALEAQRRGAEAEAAMTEVLALQHRELEALRHADHAEAYGRHDDAVHYLDKAAELRQEAERLANKVGVVNPGACSFC